MYFNNLSSHSLSLSHARTHIENMHIYASFLPEEHKDDPIPVMEW